MQRSTIAGTITHTVFVSQTGTYQSPLTVAATGDIAPRQYGADGLVVLSSVPNASIANQGLISGGPANTGTTGGIGVDFRAAGLLSNTGTIDGGSTGPTYAGNGGAGIQLDGATLQNAGFIAGGNGGYGYNATGFDGGIGVIISGGNSLSVNSGVITGGNGGYGDHGGGAGGAGLMLAAASLSNTGTITAGTSGGAPAGPAAGTAGVIMQDNAVLLNAGTITGGKPATKGGQAGVGVMLDGGTLTNAGTITAGASPGSTDAVQCGAQAATLVIDPGAVFTGLVAADTQASDQLQLAGTTAGTLSGLGTAFTGFADLTVDTSASWTLDNGNQLAGGGLTVSAGSLVVADSLTGIAHANVAAGGTLTAAGAGALSLGKLLLTGGTLDGSATGTILIGSQSAPKPGAITIADGAGIHGFGTIAGAPVIANGALVIGNGTLTVADALQGTGVAIIQDAVLDAQGAITVANLNFQGAATLIAGVPTAITSTINDFGIGDVIDLQHLLATTLSFLNGTLTLDDGSKPVATLVFNGDYTGSSFALQSDGHGGQDLLYTGEGLTWVTEVLDHFGRG
jgi:hypothetical protein